MAKLLDPKVPERFPAPDGTARALLVRVPTVADRARYRREVRSAGGRQWRVGELWRALRDGVAALAEHGDVAEELAHVDDCLARLAELGATLTGDVDEAAKRAAVDAVMALLADPRMAEIEQAVLPAYPRLRAMIADNETWGEVRGMVAARLLVVGWEGLPGEPRRGPQGLAEDSLAAIPEAWLAPLGEFVEKLLAPTEAEAGN